MILVYSGRGKGKTSACLGQAVRALGHGMRVAFAQFMKRPGCAGEQEALARLLGADFLAGGLGFLRDESERPAHRAAALATLAWCRDRLETADLLVLDEALAALGRGLLEREELEALIRDAGRASRHLALSGRDAPDWLTELADMVTEMREIRHPHRLGLPAVRGVDF